MHCANPDCKCPALNIFTGELRLIEMDAAPADRLTRGDTGFPVCAVPSRYFWLCPECAKTLRIRGWSGSDLNFVPRFPSERIASTVVDNKGPEIVRFPSLRGSILIKTA